MDRALRGVAVTKDSMLRLATLLVLFTGCLSGTHLAKGKLYETSATAHTAWKAVDGAWPVLHGTIQALAILSPSKWGDVPTKEPAWQRNRYRLYRDAAGPFTAVHPDGQALWLDGLPAAVLELELPPGRPGEVELKPRRVRRITSANPVRALDDAYARWQTYLAVQKPAIDRALDAAGEASAGRPFGPETVETTDGFVPTWVPEDQRFVVVFVRTYRRSSQLVDHVGGGCDKYRRMMPTGEVGFPEQAVACAPMPPHDIVHLRSYAADIALVLEYDADGTRTYERAYAPESMPTKGPF